MAAPYQLPSSFSGGMAWAVESIKRWSLPQAITSPVVKPAQVKQSVLPKKIDKSSQSFKDKLVNKYPDGVASDGRRYSDIPSYELVKMVSNKFPEWVTSDGVPYKDYITWTEKATLGLQWLQKAPGANIRESLIQSGKEMWRGLVQPIVWLGKGIYKAGTDIADLADLDMEKAPEDRWIIQNTVANIGTGIKDYATADIKAFQQNPSIGNAANVVFPFSERKAGAAARVLNRGLGDVMWGAMETALTPEAQQTVGTALAPVWQLFNKGLSYVPEGDKRDIAEATLNVLPIKIPGVKTALWKVSKTVGDIKLPKGTPWNIDDYVMKTYEKWVRPSVTSAKKPFYKDNVVWAVKTITENKPNLKLLDEFGEETNKLPQTLKEFTQAIDQTKKSIFDEYDAIQKQAGGKGAEVKLTTVADELQKVANDPVILDTNPAIADYAQKASDRFLERGKYTTQQAQDAIKTYNTSLDAYYRNPSYETASKAAIDAMIVNNIRKWLDDAIESLGGKWYQSLKNKYGSVKSIEKDVVNRAIVDGRKNAKWLLDFTDVFSGAEVIRGILTLNPATFATGVGASLIKTYYKYLNNPNTSIKKLFKTTEKSYLPSPKTQAANNIAPIPTKIPSNVAIKDKVNTPIIQKTGVKANLPKTPQVEGKTVEKSIISFKEWNVDDVDVSNLEQYIRDKSWKKDLIFDGYDDDFVMFKKKWEKLDFKVSNNTYDYKINLNTWEPVWVIMPIKDVYSLKGKLGDFSMQSKTPQVEGKTLEQWTFWGVKWVKPSNQAKFNQWDNFEPVRVVMNDKDARIVRYGAIRWRGLKKWFTTADNAEMKGILDELKITREEAINRSDEIKKLAREARSAKEEVILDLTKEPTPKVEVGLITGDKEIIDFIEKTPNVWFYSVGWGDIVKYLKDPEAYIKKFADDPEWIAKVERAISKVKESGLPTKPKPSLPKKSPK